jgi:hypothetical protein
MTGRHPSFMLGEQLGHAGYDVFCNLGLGQQR